MWLVDTHTQKFFAGDFLTSFGAETTSTFLRIEAAGALRRGELCVYLWDMGLEELSGSRCSMSVLEHNLKETSYGWVANSTSLSGSCSIHGTMDKEKEVVEGKMFEIVSNPNIDA